MNSSKSFIEANLRKVAAAEDKMGGFNKTTQSDQITMNIKTAINRQSDRLKVCSGRSNPIAKLECEVKIYRRLVGFIGGLSGKCNRDANPDRCKEKVLKFRDNYQETLKQRELKLNTLKEKARKGN